FSTGGGRSSTSRGVRPILLLALHFHAKSPFARFRPTGKTVPDLGVTGPAEAKGPPRFRNPLDHGLLCFSIRAPAGFLFGGCVRKSVVVLAVAGLLGLVWVSTQAKADAQIFFGPSRMPPKWDTRIPVPPRSTLLSSTSPRPGRNVYSAEPRSYDATVDFYE